MSGFEASLPIRPQVGDSGDGSEATHLASVIPRPSHVDLPSFASTEAIQDEQDRRRRTTFLRRRFGSLWTSKQAQDTSEGSVRGPLGLNLLVASPEPMIDIIFVHGLRGGSVKTWQKGRDPRLFWPLHWLPTEPEFRHANIHSFGYDSDWRSSEPSILSVHEFGQALYEEMRSSPCLRRNSELTIILIGHSMGGLVIKKAYNQARKNHTNCTIAERIRTIFFLATPHRGSDYAALLNNVLRVASATKLSSSREYINDLAVGSNSAQLINAEFLDCAEELPIFSFYETLETSIGPFSSIIVDQHSAVLGIGENERSSYINANHGNICKFRDPQDSNYMTLKNSSAAAVQDVLQDESKKSLELASTHLKSIRTFLGTSDNIEPHQERVPGSCQWIDDREDFQDWRDSLQPSDENNDKYQPSMYWVTANPGAGKTVIATHVQSQFQDFGFQHVAYYFQLGKKESESLAGFLRWSAFQMASSNAAVRDALAQFCDQASPLDLDNSRLIWSKIFQSVILQTPIQAPQYWIIDALDECVQYNEFLSLLRGAWALFPLKIFVTSRKLPDMPKLLRKLSPRSFMIVEIPVDDSMKDIELYISSRIVDLPVDDETKKADIGKRVSDKSRACFLWVRLVMDELEKIYGFENISKVLDDIPEGMIPYYQRMVADMTRNKRESHISKALLQWIALASRPLTIFEVAHALEMDLKVNLSSPQIAIEGLCGHLVSIETKNHHVSIVHATAREFLMSEEAGTLQISKAEAHERMARACLKVLSGSEMQPPRHRHMLQRRPNAAKTLILADYATNHFSDHVLGVPATDDETFRALFKFLSTTTLTWIERVAASGNTYNLIRTAKNIKAYLESRPKSSNAEQHDLYIDNWVTDLGRLSIKFGMALTTSPQSIYFLIPPLCPIKTPIYSQCRRAHDNLSLVGSTDEHWDDCLATLDFGEEKYPTLAYGDHLLAIGFQSGHIRLYDPRTYEIEKVICNDTRADQICFASGTTSLAVWGFQSLYLWDLQGILLWEAPVPRRDSCLLLTVSAAYILVILRSGKAKRWDMETGDLIDEKSFVYQPLDHDGTPLDMFDMKLPTAAALAPDGRVLALVYRHGPVCLFDVESTELIGWAAHPKHSYPQHLVFNPSPHKDLLLVVYERVIFGLHDSWSGALVKASPPRHDVLVNSVACSPNGKTFATVDIRGRLNIWDFESLTMIYSILTEDHTFRILQFTSDNTCLLDMTSNGMKVWSLPASARGVGFEERRLASNPMPEKIPENHYETFQSARISCIASHPRHPFVFVGRRSGDVEAFDLKDGREIGVLYTHTNTSMVVHMEASSLDMIASSDMDSRVQVWDLVFSEPAIVAVDKRRCHLQFKPRLHQVLFSACGEYLLVSTDEVDSVFKTSDFSRVGTLSWNKDERSVWRWTCAPNFTDITAFALACDHTLTFYQAPNFPSKSHPVTFLLDYKTDEGFQERKIESLSILSRSSCLVLEYVQKGQNGEKSSMALYQLPNPTTMEPSSLSPFVLIPEKLYRRFLGVGLADERLVFMDRNSWVCSVAAPTSTNIATQYTQHFFVPSDFMTSTIGATSTRPVQTIDGTFIFPKYEKVAIVKNGLKFHEVKDLEGQLAM